MVKQYPQLFREQLRDAILNADTSRFRIVQETGLTEANLSMDSVDKICECLDLRLIPAEKSKRKGG